MRTTDEASDRYRAERPVRPYFYDATACAVCGSEDHTLEACPWMAGKVLLDPPDPIDEDALAA